METNVNYTLVGAFVITLICFIILSVIWLSSGFSVGQYSTYQVYMNESVTGLNIDSNVEFNGVNVGSVKNIEIDSYNPHLVVLLLRIKNGTPITRGTRAVLTSRGLTGVTYIALIDQGKDLTPLTIRQGETYPVITTAPSFLGRLDTSLHKLVEGISKMANSIQALLNEENLHTIKDILADTQQVTRTLAANSDIIDNLDIITQNLADISVDIKENPAILIRGTKRQHLGPGE
jgi:phospholipid/cholesterol/gamma-HCH transport system substrate-binding protein